MILTVTLNASIDKLYLMPSIVPDTVMRVREVHNTAGGKGLNVSRIAAGLGEPVAAMGFTGGWNGKYLESLIRDPRITPAFTHVAAETRSCINCWDLATGRSTEYLEPGAPVSAEEVDRFFRDFEEMLPRAGVVTISGSAPEGVPADAYGRIIRLCRGAGVPVLVDTSGERLRLAAQEKPTFLKPNADEIAQLTGAPVNGLAEGAAAVERLRRSGIDCAVLSLGGDGALLACGEGTFHGRPPKIIPRNTVGCGDSMVAGFAVGFARRLPVLETFRMALAVSAASALSLFTGDFDPADYERLSRDIVLQKLA